MKRALKWIGIIIAILIVLVLVLPFLINVNTFRPRIESELTNALGRKVAVGNLSLSLWSGSLAADDIAIADDRQRGGFDDPAQVHEHFCHRQQADVGIAAAP